MGKLNISEGKEKKMTHSTSMFSGNPCSVKANLQLITNETINSCDNELII